MMFCLIMDWRSAMLSKVLVDKLMVTSVNVAISCSLVKLCDSGWLWNSSNDQGTLRNTHQTSSSRWWWGHWVLWVWSV